jgi:poly(A) polymerase
MKKVKVNLKFDSSEGKAAVDIVFNIMASHRQAFIVGGAVRDAILGLEPKDVDVATDMHPSELVNVFGVDNVNFVGESFGVAIVSHMGEKVEVATFRKDGVYMDGRRPESVEFSSNMKDDADRRDLTMNALFFCPGNKVVIDFHGGLKDLKNGVVRTVGDPHRRFGEDFLRMLRVVRFASRLKFTVDTDTVEAIKDNAHRINDISGERIFMELDKMFTKSPVIALAMLRRFGLLKHVLPEVEALIGVEQPPHWHPEGDVWNHVIIMLGSMKKPAESSLAWAVLLHDIGKPSTAGINDKGNICFHGHASVSADMAEDILRRMKCSSKFIATVCSVVGNHMKMHQLSKAKRSKVRRQLARPTIDIDLELSRLDSIGKGAASDLSDYNRMLEIQAEFVNEPPVPEPLVNGRDAMSVGIESGPEMGAILREVQDLQLMGQLNSKEEAMEFLRQRVTQ